MSDQTKPRPILAHLHRLLLWIALPLVLVIGVQGYLAFLQANRAAEGLVRAQVAAVAAEVDAFLADTERSLRLMAARPGVLLMDPQRCDPALADLIAIQPNYANVTVIDATGRLICGARMPAAGQPAVNVSDRDWFQAVMAGRPFAVGAVRRGPVLGRWVSSAAVPIRGADKSVFGAMVVVIDLSKWVLHTATDKRSDEQVLGVLSRDGTMVLRSPDAEKWIGRDTQGSTILADFLRVGEGAFVATGAQGFDRFWAIAPIARAPWIAFAGVSTQAVHAGPLREVGIAFAVILVIVLAAWWLALKASQRLTAPISQLARAAARAGGGDLGARAELTGPAEIAAVARELNLMLELRGSAETALRASEQRLRDTFRLMPDLLTLQTADGVVLDCSDELCRVTGYARDEVVGRNTLDLGLWADPAQGVAWRDSLQRDAQVDGFEFSMRQRGGSTTFMQVSARFLVIGGERLLLSSAHDVSARKQAQDELLATRSHLQATLGAIPDLLFEVGASGRFHGNHTHRADLLAAPPEVFLGKTIAEVLPPDAAAVCMAALREAAEKGWSGGGDIGFWDWDLATGGLIVNERWRTMLGLDPEGPAPGIELWNSLVHPADAPQLARLFEEQILDPAGEGGEVEVRARHRAGHYIWILDKFSVVVRAADGKPLRAVGTHMDITPRKQAELALRASLQEKEALLKEVHHRVKNNLQVISSLLRLESGRSGHAPTQGVLADMQGRIRAMALLHESIYREGHFAAIDLGAYVKQVATQALRSLQTSGTSAQRRLRLELGSVQAGLDQATPCGLLLTELVSNALKHAFGAGGSGEVCVELQPVQGGAPDEWCLRVSDNGVGLPADFAARQQDSLGLQLVASLATQMAGSLVVGAGGGLPDNTAPGASFAVSFTVATLQ